MTASTFTIATKAASANQKGLTPAAHVLPDGFTRPGEQAAALRTGAVFQAKRPDGSLGLFVMDERSTPDAPVMRPY